MPLRKKLRNVLFGKSNRNEGKNNTIIHKISAPEPLPDRPIPSQQYSPRPQYFTQNRRRCHYCDKIVVLPYEIHKGHKRYLPYNHHRSFRDLLKSADQGCDICVIFRDRLMSLGVSQEWDNASVLLFSDEQLEWASGAISSHEYSETTHLTVKLVTESGDGKKTSLAAVKFGLFEQQVNATKTCVVGRPVAPDPRSAQCINLLHDWLHECLKNHISCQMKETEFFPTRIIDVGPTDGSQEPRLVVTKAQDLKAPYIALSHCWGGTQCLTATTENINERLKSIPLSSMPANFRDAVWVTRRSGMRYLWIDSLCIVQDSKGDWELEAERMGEVYGNAFLTIAATDAKNSSEGFLHPRPESVTKTLATLSCREGDGAEISNLSLREYPNAWKDGVEPSVLNGRGWTLQERVMPARVVHFGKQMLYWECHSTIKSEAGLSPNETVVYGSSIFSKARLYNLWNEEQQGSFSDDLERWYTCVDEFSGRKLTCHTDKLPAVAGIAKSMRIRVPELDVYYAGIWKADFVRGLLWRARKLGCLSQPSTYRAPSWSWAALDGEITHDWSRLKYFDPTWWPAIEGISVRCKGRSSYGEIQSAWLRLKAPIRPAVYGGTAPIKTLAIIAPYGQTIQPENDPKEQCYDLWHFEPHSWQPVGPSLCRAYFDEPIEEGRLRPYVLMCLGKFSSFIKPENWWEENDWDCNFWAMILEADEDSGSGVLKRVGVASLYDKKNAFRGWGSVEKTIV